MMSQVNNKYTQTQQGYRCSRLLMGTTVLSWRMGRQGQGRLILWKE